MASDATRPSDTTGQPVEAADQKQDRAPSGEQLPPNSDTVQPFLSRAEERERIASMPDAGGAAIGKDNATPTRADEVRPDGGGPPARESGPNENPRTSSDAKDLETNQFDSSSIDPPQSLTDRESAVTDVKADGNQGHVREAKADPSDYRGTPSTVDEPSAGPFPAADTSGRLTQDVTGDAEKPSDVVVRPGPGDEWSEDQTQDQPDLHHAGHAVPRVDNDRDAPRDRLTAGHAIQVEVERDLTVTNVDDATDKAREDRASDRPARTADTAAADEEEATATEELVEQEPESEPEDGLAGTDRPDRHDEVPDERAVEERLSDPRKLAPQETGQPAVGSSSIEQPDDATTQSTSDRQPVGQPDRANASEPGDDTRSDQRTTGRQEEPALGPLIETLPVPRGDERPDEGDEKGKPDRFFERVKKNAETIDDVGKKTTEILDKVLGPSPAGHPEVRIDSGPYASEAPHTGIESGSVASGVLAAAILVGEVVRRLSDYIRKKGDK